MANAASTLVQELALFGVVVAALSVGWLALRERSAGAVLRGVERVAAIPERRFLVLLVLLAVAPRMIVALAVPDALSSDAYWYHARAVDLLEGRGYVRPGPVTDGESTMIPTAFWPVGFSAFLCAVYAVCGASWRAGIAVNAVLAGAGVVVLYRVARWCVGERAARVAALLMCASPALLARSLLAEPLFMLLLWCGVWWALARSANWRAAVGAGVLFAAATYVKVNALPYLALPALVWWAKTRRWRATARLSAVCAATVGVCCLPWTVRNWRELGAWVPTTTSGGVALLLGAHDGADGREPSRYDAPALAEVMRQRLEAFDEVGSDRTAERLARAWIAAHPLRWTALGAAKVAWTALLPPWEPPMQWRGEAGAPARGVEMCFKAASRGCGWATLCAFVLYAGVLGRRWLGRGEREAPAGSDEREAPPWLIALPLAAWLVTMGQAFVFVGYGRLRVPVEGMLIAAGASAVLHCLAQRAGERAAARAGMDHEAIDRRMMLGADRPDLLHSPV